jgi:hypothetical protein
VAARLLVSFALRSSLQLGFSGIIEGRLLLFGSFTAHRLELMNPPGPHHAAFQPVVCTMDIQHTKKPLFFAARPLGFIGSGILLTIHLPWRWFCLC